MCDTVAHVSAAIRLRSMQTSQRIFWYMALWLAMAFSTLMPGKTALANCRMAGHLATRRACCATHSGACCHSVQKGSPRCGTSSNSCVTGSCTCDLTPTQGRAPFPRSTVDHSLPAILGSNACMSSAAGSRRNPLRVDSYRFARTLSLRPSSPRAPPFQG